MTTKEEEEQMAAMYADLTKACKQVEESNNRLYQAIKSVRGEKFYKDLMRLLKENECGGGMFPYMDHVVRKTTGRYTKESFGSIKGFWVDQYVNGGMEGDSFEGYIYVKLKEGRFLKTHYSM